MLDKGFNFDLITNRSPLTQLCLLLIETFLQIFCGIKNILLLDSRFAGEEQVFDSLTLTD